MAPATALTAIRSASPAASGESRFGDNGRDIETPLGYRDREEMIHRDAMALTQNTPTQSAGLEEDTP